MDTDFCNIDRVGSISLQEFEDKYFDQAPVIFKAAPDNEAGREALSRHALLARFASVSTAPLFPLPHCATSSDTALEGANVCQYPVATYNPEGVPYRGMREVLLREYIEGLDAATVSSDVQTDETTYLWR